MGVGSRGRIFVLFFFYLLVGAVVEGGVLVLAMWSDDLDATEEQDYIYVLLYGLCMLGEFIIAPIRYGYLCHCTQTVWDRIHKALVRRILAARLSWLQLVPVCTSWYQPRPAWTIPDHP